MCCVSSSFLSGPLSLLPLRISICVSPPLSLSLCLSVLSPALCLSPPLCLCVSRFSLQLCVSQSFCLSIFMSLLVSLSSLCLSSSLCLHFSISGGWCPVPTTVSRRKVQPGSGGKGSGPNPYRQPQSGRGSSVLMSQDQQHMDSHPRMPPARLPDMLPLFLMQEIPYDFRSGNK